MTMTTLENQRDEAWAIMSNGAQEATWHSAGAIEHRMSAERDALYKQALARVAELDGKRLIETARG